jgi:lipoprotein-anchoring transpeptidase ErfK/SrfK
MIRAFPFRSSPLSGVPARGASGLLVGLLILFAMLLLIAGAVVTAIALSPPGLAVSVPDQGAVLPVNGSITIAPEGWDARLDRAALWETPLEQADQPGAAREVPFRLDTLRSGWEPGGNELAIHPVNGAFRADASYRLVLSASAWTADPWPRLASVEREIRFLTPAAPVALPMLGTKSLKWGEPLQISWSQPIDDFRIEVTPPTATRTWLGPNRTTAYVTLEDPADSGSYDVKIVDARNAHGIHPLQTTTYRVTAAARPRPIEADHQLRAELGKTVPIRWNMPIKDMTVEISPPVANSWQPDRSDPSVAQLRLDDAEQGTRYEVTITKAVAQSGAPLVEPRTLTLVTPDPLTVSDFQTGEGRSRVSVGVRPVITFAEPIRDRQAAQSAISIEPSVLGRFEWLDDRQVQFVPTRTFPYESEVTFEVRPGADGARSTDGRYLEEPVAFKFTTESDKLIDVDVTRQKMTLFERNQPVRTFTVATGVPGADTPIGEFNVQYKMPTARFRGTNVTGSTYDLPNVKWVLAFMGDYTIHGTYWRSNFGAPASNGCVSLTDADAKTVFDWAPEGTRIRIHY